MLSARYIHLADALGLGALWLKRGAKVITPQTRPTLTHTPNAKRIQLPKIKAKQKPAPAPIATPTIDPAALLAVRCVWTKTVAANGVSVLWLTLRSQLNISAAELTEKSTVGKLLRQLIYAASRMQNMSVDKLQNETRQRDEDSINNTARRSNAVSFSKVIDCVWHHLPDNSVISSSLKLPDSADKIIVLSEELAQYIQTDIPKLTLPHPERLRETPQRKSEVWQKVQAFLR